MAQLTDMNARLRGAKEENAALRNAPRALELEAQVRHLTQARNRLEGEKIGLQREKVGLQQEKARVESENARLRRALEANIQHSRAALR